MHHKHLSDAGLPRFVEATLMGGDDDRADRFADLDWTGGMGASEPAGATGRIRVTTQTDGGPKWH